jgi:predicted metal-dependent phosphoesterase TrpH
VLKVELHAHTAPDPADYIPHTTRELIDRASALGYGALAITLHNLYYDPAADRDYARGRGLVLIPGVERTIERRHILLLNFPPESAGITTFDELRALRLRHPRGLVIAPHAFYPTSSAVGADADRCADLFDAVEVNSVFMSWLNFNRRAVDWALAHGKPMVGNTDLHLLDQLGSTYTLVDAAPDPDAICDAIRAGRVQVRSAPLSFVRCVWILGRMGVTGVIGRVRSVVWRVVPVRR